MKKIINFDTLLTIINISGGMFIGNFASEYTWWILVLMIPHTFFIGCVEYFRWKLKKLELGQQLNKI